MAIKYVCSFDHYGPAVGFSANDLEWHIGNDNLLGDGWSDIPRRTNFSFLSNVSGNYSIAAPAWGARSGDYALIASNVAAFTTAYDLTKTGSESLRLVLPGASDTTRLIHLAFSISELPLDDKATGYILDFLNTSGVIRGSLAVSPSGRLQILNGASLTMSKSAVVATPAALLVSSAPVIQAQTWYYLSIQITTNAINANANIDVYINDIVLGNKVLSGTDLALTDTGSNNIDLLGVLPASYAPADTTQRAVRDIVICDTSGAYNNSLLGQCFVSAQEMRVEDDEGAGWTVNRRENIGDGILDSKTNNTGLRCDDAAALEIGASDFTFETWIRFNALPGSSEEANVIAKWRADNNTRSYRLVYYGSDNTIRWECSVDGISVVTVKDLPWLPTLAKWYHVAVVRASSQTLLFINGVQYGVPVADANTYFDGAATLGIAARYSNTTLVANTAVKGWLDETRLTIGVARYTSDFAPSTVKFGRNVTDDTSFASVALLLGYDSLSLADESSYGRTVSTTSPALTAIQPDDGDHSYKVLNNRPYLDDTYIEAAQTFAENVFTFEAVPTAAETITVGANTYTWVTALSTAGTYEVVIGADIAGCISNIIAAINDSTGSGTIYSSGIVANAAAAGDTFASPQFIVRAATIGAGGNSVVTTDTMVNGYFSSATLLGGQDIPPDSDFAIERLPIDVTGILGVQMTTRQYKTDAGSATLRVDLVGPAGAVAAGSAKNPDLNPAWERQIFEEDPDTAAGLTPSTMIGGRMRFKRTV